MQSRCCSKETQVYNMKLFSLHIGSEKSTKAFFFGGGVVSKEKDLKGLEFLLVTSSPSVATFLHHAAISQAILKN
jgi:hypothetical protein